MPFETSTTTSNIVLASPVVPIYCISKYKEAIDSKVHDETIAGMCTVVQLSIKNTEEVVMENMYDILHFVSLRDLSMRLAIQFSLTFLKEKLGIVPDMARCHPDSYYQYKYILQRDYRFSRLIVDLAMIKDTIRFVGPNGLLGTLTEQNKCIVAGFKVDDLEKAIKK